MKMVLFVDQEDGLVLYSVDSKGNKEYCESMEDFYEIVKYLDMAGYTIIKNGNDLILNNKAKDLQFKIVNYRRVFSFDDVRKLKRSVDEHYRLNGAIDGTNRKNVSSRKVHNSKHASKFLKKVSCFVVAGSIIVGGVLAVNGVIDKHNHELTPAEYYTEISKPEEPLYIQDIGIDSSLIVEEEEPVMEEEQIEEAPEVEINYSTFATLNYEDNSNSEKAISCRENYFDIIKRIAPKYGVDPELILSIATQERGTHSTTVDDGGGLGLMQIQYAVWANEYVDYYVKAEDGHFIHTSQRVTDDMMRDLESNIELGCRIFQECLVYTGYNIPMAIQMYNQGYGSIHDLLVNYCAEKGLDRGELCNTPSDLGWYSRTDGYAGDPEYLEHVLQWAGSNPTFTCTDVDTGEEVSFTFSNRAQVRQ